MEAEQAPDLELGRPQVARMYDYYLGGNHNYEADEEAAEKVLEALPSAATAARENRAFMHRAVHWLAGEVGIRQFLDIGSGIPTEPNLHQIAQAVAPECRVVYVDNDPIVRVHAQALLTGTDEGRAAFIEADVTRPDTILSAPELRETLDASQPVAVSLISLLTFVPDECDAYGIVNRLLSTFPSGSALVIAHATGDFAPEAMQNVVEIYGKGGIKVQVRSKAQVGRFFTGLVLAEPGIELAHRWRPESHPAEVSDVDVSVWVGVALKP